MVAPAPFPSELEVGESVTNYNSQRVMREFDLNQGSMTIFGTASFSSIQDFESKFIYVGRNNILLVLHFFYREEKVSCRWGGGALLYWLNCIAQFEKSAHNEHEDSPVSLPQLLYS